MRQQLSVVIPAWRAEKYIAQAIGSVREQNWPGELEIIVCDDGSDDATAQIARDLGVTVLEKAQGGAASARNEGLRAATGDFVLLLDADDRLTPGALAALFEPMAGRAELMAVFGRAEDFLSEELTPEQKAALKPRTGSYGGVLPGCCLMRKEVFEQIGLFDESLKSGETVAWQMKLRDAGLQTAQVDVVTLQRRLHLTNTGRLFAKREMADYAALLRKRMRKT